MQESGDNSVMMGLDNEIIVQTKSWPNQPNTRSFTISVLRKNVYDYLNYLNISLKIKL